MIDINRVGEDWTVEQVEALTDKITHVKPSAFNEANRYLPGSVSSMPGYIRYNVTPYMREIVDCLSTRSPIRDITLMKGVQVAYTTAVLEAAAFYYMAHIKTLPIMYMSADKDLADARIENNFIPMLNESGFGDIIRSSDELSSRKTGKTKKHLQFEGGGYMVPFGAVNANKMRQYSIAIMLKDEVDGWPLTVGRADVKEGDPDKLSDDRTLGYHDTRKILRGSTPLIMGVSKVHKAFLKGDQRKYMVLCNACSFAQFLRWSTLDKITGMIGGMLWDTDGGVLIAESVRYACRNCGHEHFEHDKEKLFSEEHGAHWKPTARPVNPLRRSYHLPAMYSPIGMRPWSSCVADYLEAYDESAERVIDVSAYQVFYNNVLGEPFEIMGSKVYFKNVSAHRRTAYRLGQVPNEYATANSESPILFLTMTVDVHKENLAVAVMGWTKRARCYLVDYWRFETAEAEADCTELESSVWGRLRELIDEKEYEADDGKKYRICLTLIDAGYANDTVVNFCNEWNAGVYPILGRARPAKNQQIKEFGEWETTLKTTGYAITVDHYKDRIADVLRRQWVKESGPQGAYHFNAPVDTTDKQLIELTKETRREKDDGRGNISYEWHRPGNARNELWDLLVYGHAAVEILAYGICIKHFELEKIDWDRLWDYIETERLYFSE